MTYPLSGALSTPVANPDGSAVGSADVALLGALTEAAPATDTASSGLNGRLQRIAQHLSALVEVGPPYPFTHSAIAHVAIADRFVASVDMKVGLYNLANGTMPGPGARRVSVTVVAGDTADTMGTVTVAGTGLDGEPLSESIAPVAGSTVIGTQWFLTVTSVTGVGWAVDGAEANPDAITVGCEAAAALVVGDGMLHAVAVNTTANGAITLTHGGGTIAILKANIPEGTVYYDVAFTGWLAVLAAAASDITVIHTT